MITSPILAHLQLGLLCGSGTRVLLDFFEVAIGPDGLANIVFADSGNANSPSHVSFARQNSGPLLLTNPRTVTCLASVPSPISAVSRKTHGSSGTFDVDLLPPAPGIECRSGGANGDHQIVVTFPLPVTISGATVSSGTGSVGGTSVSGNTVTINLTGVTDVQRLTVTLNNVTDANGSGNVPINMGVLLGDVNANAIVSNTDVAAVKAQVTAPVGSSNFRNDVNVNGVISNTDVAVTKAAVSNSLP